MLSLQATTKYRKDRKLAIKRGLRMKLLDDVIHTKSHCCCAKAAAQHAANSRIRTTICSIGNGNWYQTLIEEKPLDPEHHDHALTGSYAGFRECHIQPDWLLIYAI